MDQKDLLKASNSGFWSGIGAIGKGKKLKTVWREESGEHYAFFCPLCKKSRRLAYRLQPGGFKHYGSVAFTTLIFMIFTWDFFSWKGAVAFIPLWSLFELTYRWRTRASLRCKDCGFDPYLFNQNLKLAQHEVDAHWRKKYADKGIPFPEKQQRPRSEKPRNPPPQSPTSPL